MTNGEIIVVVTPRDYSLSELQLDNIALEFMGMRVDLVGGIDDAHYMFEKKTYSNQFKTIIEKYKIE